jgi:hypothetical protein
MKRGVLILEFRCSFFLERFRGVITRAYCCFAENPDHSDAIRPGFNLTRNQLQRVIVSSERNTTNPKAKQKVLELPV